MEIAEQNGTSGLYQLPVLFINKEQADKLAGSLEKYVAAAPAFVGSTASEAPPLVAAGPAA